jgi:hypothetical protein
MISLNILKKVDPFTLKIFRFTLFRSQRATWRVVSGFLTIDKVALIMSPFSFNNQVYVLAFLIAGLYFLQPNLIMGKSLKHFGNQKLICPLNCTREKGIVQDFGSMDENTDAKKRKSTKSKHKLKMHKNPSKLRFMHGKFRGKINRKNGVNRCYTMYLPNHPDRIDVAIKILIT